MFLEWTWNVFLPPFYTLFSFWGIFLRGLCSDSKDAKIKDSLRKILENIVNVCFNQVTE